jgi:hypothetical protein
VWQNIFSVRCFKRFEFNWRASQSATLFILDFPSFSRRFPVSLLAGIELFYGESILIPLAFRAHPVEVLRLPYLTTHRRVKTIKKQLFTNKSNRKPFWAVLLLPRMMLRVELKCFALFFCAIPQRSFLPLHLLFSVILILEWKALHEFHSLLLPLSRILWHGILVNNIATKKTRRKFSKSLEIPLPSKAIEYLSFGN